MRPQGLLLAAAGSRGASAETHTIVQIERSFRPNEITIAAGDSLAFSNQDEFIHEIYVDSDKNRLRFCGTTARAKS